MIMSTIKVDNLVGFDLVCIPIYLEIMLII